MTGREIIEHKFAEPAASSIKTSNFNTPQNTSKTENEFHKENIFVVTEVERAHKF